MLKMQDAASGGVYHKVTALVFPETVLAVDETDDMVLAPISYAATADFAAVMAKASVLYAEYDADLQRAVWMQQRTRMHFGGKSGYEGI